MEVAVCLAFQGCHNAGTCIYMDKFAQLATVPVKPRTPCTHIHTQSRRDSIRPRRGTMPSSSHLGRRVASVTPARLCGARFMCLLDCSGFRCFLGQQDVMIVTILNLTIVTARSKSRCPHTNVSTSRTLEADWVMGFRRRGLGLCLGGGEAPGRVHLPAPPPPLSVRHPLCCSLPGTSAKSPYPGAAGRGLKHGQP